MSEQKYRLEENNQTNELILLEDVKILNVFKNSYDNRKHLNIIVDRLNEQQSTIEKQKRIIKSQDAEISRQYNLCLIMSGILREEFGVYDVFDRTKDKNIKKEDD